MFKNILLAYDGSDHSCRAAEIAAGLARQQPDAKVYVVTVVDPTSRDLGEPFQSEAISRRMMEGQNTIDRAKDLIGEGIDLHSELIFGSPAESIIQIAETRACDLIVMGSRGLSPVRGLLLGSQTQRVISLALCPVLVVKRERTSPDLESDIEIEAER